MQTHTMIDGDPLWVPLLSHFQDDGGIDPIRMKAHLDQVSPHVKQIMLAGSTGDGWELDDQRFQELIEFSAAGIKGEIRVMFGALAPDTEGVISRILMVEETVKRLPRLGKRYAGVTVCPPVDPQATQSDILAHYQEVMRRTTSPVSVYQLPQITGCEIAPETLQKLVEDPRVMMFKDSSGVDAVASSGRSFAPAIMLRGAEGGYVQAVTEGGYGGWLLSTANAFGDVLRRIEVLLRSGQVAEATALSDRLGSVISRLFDAAADEGGANAFSNANRAADHLRAHGNRWRSAPPPLKQDGKPVSNGLVEEAAGICEKFISLDAAGYLDR